MPANDHPQRHPLCRQHQDESTQRWREHLKDFREVKDAVVEHRLRLENGTHVFAEQRKDMGELRTAIDELRPKPPSTVRVASIVFVIFMAAAGALWALSNMLRDRPTTDQIQKIMYDHAGNDGHPSLVTEIKDVQREQTVQGKRLEKIQTTQEETSQDVKEIKHSLDKGKPNSRKPNR